MKRKLLIPIALFFSIAFANATIRTIHMVSYTGFHYFTPSTTTVYVGDTVLWTLDSNTDMDTTQTNLQMHSQWNNWTGAAATGTQYFSQTGNHTYSYVVMVNPTQNGLGAQFNGNFAAMQGYLNVSWFTGVANNVVRNNFAVLNNPITGNNVNVSISLKQTGRTEIVVYDLLGKKVEVLFDEQLSAGETSKTFNLNSNYQNGFYFVSLKQGEMVMTRKIMIQ